MYSTRSFLVLAPALHNQRENHKGERSSFTIFPMLQFNSQSQCSDNCNCWSSWSSLSRYPRRNKTLYKVPLTRIDFIQSKASSQVETSSYTNSCGSFSWSRTSNLPLSYLMALRPWSMMVRIEGAQVVM